MKTLYVPVCESAGPRYWEARNLLADLKITDREEDGTPSEVPCDGYFECSDKKAKSALRALLKIGIPAAILVD